jgi:hypothetical protein
MCVCSQLSDESVRTQSKLVVDYEPTCLSKYSTFGVALDDVRTLFSASSAS